MPNSRGRAAAGPIWRCGCLGRGLCSSTGASRRAGGGNGRPSHRTAGSPHESGMGCIVVVLPALADGGNVRQALRKLTASLSKSNTLIIFINQVGGGVTRVIYTCIPVNTARADSEQSWCDVRQSRGDRRWQCAEVLLVRCLGVAFSASDFVVCSHVCSPCQFVLRFESRRS